MLNRVMTVVGSILIYASLTRFTAYAADGGDSEHSVIWAVIGGILGCVLVLVPLILASKTKKKATEATNYIKQDNGGESDIVYRQDVHIKNYTETRNK